MAAAVDLTEWDQDHLMVATDQDPLDLALQGLHMAVDQVDLAVAEISPDPEVDRPNLPAGGASFGQPPPGPSRSKGRSKNPAPMTSTT